MLINSFERNAWKKDLTREEAHEVLVKAMQVLYYRDCRALNRVEFAVVTAKGVEISEAVELETKWYVKMKEFGIKLFKVLIFLGISNNLLNQAFNKLKSIYKKKHLN